MIVNGNGFSVTSLAVEPRFFSHDQTVTVTFKAKATTAAFNGYVTVNVHPAGGGVPHTIYQSPKEAWFLNREKTVTFSYMQGPLHLSDREKEHGYSAVRFSFDLTASDDPYAEVLYYCTVTPEVAADGKTEWRYIHVDSTHPPIPIPVVSMSDATLANGLDVSLYDYFGAVIKGKSAMTYTVSKPDDIVIDQANPNNKIVSHGLGFGWGGPVIADDIEWEEPNATGVFGDPVGGYKDNTFYVYGRLDDLYHFGWDGTGPHTAIDYGAPLLTNVVVERYNPDTIDAGGNHTYPADDAGTRVRFGFLADVQAIAGKNAWTLSLEYGPVGTPFPQTKDLKSGAEGAATSVSIESDEARGFLALTSVPETERWYFKFTLSDMVASTSVTVFVERAGGIFNIEKHGLGFGMRAQASTGDSKRADVAEGFRFVFHNDDGTVFEFPPRSQDIASLEGMAIVVSGGKVTWGKGGGGGGGISPASAMKSVAQQQFQNNAEVESVDLPGATTLGTYAFSGCSNLKTVNLPLVTTIPNNCFQDCVALETVDLGSATSLGYSSFSGCTSLKRLIIRSSTRCSVTNNTFTGSGFANGTCEVYVNSNLVASYQGASVWNTNKNKIFAIEDYPEITGG